MKKFWQKLGVIGERVTAETPIFFKRIIAISLAASAAAVAVLASPWHISERLHTICENLAIAGVVAAAISKTTKVDKPNDANTPQ
jgi:hypothetical protein